eukprot:TRINITY_DN118_c0_g1_i1.p1 TRINITY_DN118_c0_g1~~TRINITY_DN118_c0_g1_i1.p1  ORF type:complete len:234 (-),score=44.96 TRINITY_DN118_c0_g1_i1:251-952(-)
MPQDEVRLASPDTPPVAVYLPWDAELFTSPLALCESSESPCCSSDDDFFLDEADDWAYEDYPTERPCPFWYGVEEGCHAEAIVRAYEKYIFVDEPASLPPSKRHSAGTKISRPIFIGRITRVPTTQQQFCTLDKVELYRTDPRLIGSSMTPMSTYRLLTVWDPIDGLPISFVDLTDDFVSYSYWHDREDMLLRPSFINRLPIWATFEHYKIFVDNHARTIGFADEPFHFTPFL